MKIRYLNAMLMLAIGFSAVSASAQTRLCIEVHAEKSQLEDLNKLIIDELAHHPSHLFVESDCHTHLQVDLLRVEGQLFLTARIGQHIPVRYELKDPRELGDKLRDGLSLVLQNDPVYLSKDISHFNAVERMSHSILKRGHNTWRFEMFQSMSNSGAGAIFAPGGALGITRGSGNWQVLARIYCAGMPAIPDSRESSLRLLAGAEGGLTWEASSLASASFYISAGLGLQYKRIEVWTASGQPEEGFSKGFDLLNASMMARVGVRFLRTFDFDFDVFAAGHLPLIPFRLYQDSDRFGPNGSYSPSLQFGLGVGF